MIIIRKMAEGTSTGDTCGSCENMVRKKQKGLKCDSCQQWFHTGCEEVNDELYAMLKKYEDQMWFCKPCKQQVKNVMMKKFKQMEKQTEELMEKVQDLERKIENKTSEVVNEVTSLTHSLRNEIGLSLNRVDLNEESMVQRATDRILEIIQEREDRGKRVNNLVLYNVPESNKQQDKEKQDEDMAFCWDIFENSLGLEKESFNIRTVTRMGRNVIEGRNRPILVKLTEEHEKWTIIKNAKRMKDEQDPIKKRIGIALDLTAKQREEDRLLKQELHERRSRGETGLYIKNGKLCKAREVIERRY